MPYRRRQRVDTLGDAFTSLRSDYNAAKQTRYRRRRTGVSATGSGADFHYKSDADYLRMLELSRDFERNDIVVGQGITRLIDSVIQDGMRLDPQTGDKETDAILLAKWIDWSSDPDQCHIAGELPFHEQEKLVLRQTIVDGDIVALPTIGGQIELIEAHRLRTPKNTKRNVIHGVLLDRNRRRLEYWFARDNIDPHRQIQRVGDMRRIPARDEDGRKQVFHIYHPRRVSQTRGITFMAPIADAVGMHDDIQFAQLVKAQVSSCFSIFHNREPGADEGGDPQTGARETDTLGDGSSRSIEGIAPGMEVWGAPGETLQGFSPNIPNPEFFPHAMMILTFIAVNLNLPVAVLLLDPTKTNFSGWRGAIDQARITFREMQNWMISFFHGPVYRWKVRQWLMEDDDLAARAARLETQNGDIYRHRWNPPTWAYIEPLKDASADLLRVRNALISPRRLHDERGRNWPEIVAEIVEDNSLAITTALAAANQINEQFSPMPPVSWRELISLPTPDGVTVSLNAAGDGAASGNEGSNNAA